jgi:hypothetical protein
MRECPKCGSNDIAVKFVAKGDDAPRMLGKFTGRSTEFVNRERILGWTANKDCLCKSCRRCSFYWDTVPLDTRMCDAFNRMLDKCEQAEKDYKEAKG